MSCWMAFKWIFTSSRFRNSSGYVFFWQCAIGWGRYRNQWVWQEHTQKPVQRASGQNHTNKKGLFNNSRTAIAGAIIGLLLVFYNSKNLNCIGALSFYDSKRSIGEVLFFNQFYWSDFWSGKWNLRKKLEWFWCRIKVMSGASGFCSYRCFWESEKLMCKKFSLSERNFCSRAAF